MSDPSETAPAIPPPEGLAEALARKDALLHEIDHRVKNNLQLIASLILLQSRRTPDEAARTALKSVLERVTAVATVHRRLFQADPLRFDVADFLRDLAGDLAAAAKRDDLEIALDLDDLAVAAAAAAPLALVINELLGNALKHAFPPPRGGRVAVSLRGGEEHFRLSIADDGVGLAGRPPGFGLTIVKLLCQQLHAEFEIVDAGPGVRATVTVPLTVPMPAAGP
jgi:two-component sensor histidine kinase